MTDKVTAALAAIGLAPDDVDPDVLAGLRTAADKPPKQLTQADLERMSAEQIVAAEADGRLDHLLGRQGA
ncbi:MAG: hypothetical protein EA387_04145 [Nitriliruptor sp.]|nr:MAG: hypothetical protein EA387_04145 [Nitriliruptor sp.]